LKKYTSDYAEGFGVEFDVSVEERMCQINEEVQIKGLLKWTMYVIRFFVMKFLMNYFLATYLPSSSYFRFSQQYTNGNFQLKVNISKIVALKIYHLNYSCLLSDDWLTAFSLINNTNQMISTKRESSDIKIAHGIRFINIIFLIVAHKSILIFYEPYANKNDLLEISTTPWSVLLRSAVLYTDSFLMLSGMLTAYSFFGRYSRGQKISLFNEYAGRYLRLVTVFKRIREINHWYFQNFPINWSINAILHVHHAITRRRPSMASCYNKKLRDL
jgi:hypothetical protein